MDSPSGARAGLLAVHRPMLARLLHDTPRKRGAGALCAYVVLLTEPTGYLVAVGLAQHCGGLNPDPVIRAAVGAGVRAPVLIGVAPRVALVTVLAALIPASRELAGAVAASRLPRPRPAKRAVRVLVAASGAAELFLLDDLPEVG